MLPLGHIFKTPDIEEDSLYLKVRHLDYLFFKKTRHTADIIKILCWICTAFWRPRFRKSQGEKGYVKEGGINLSFASEACVSGWSVSSSQDVEHCSMGYSHMFHIVRQSAFKVPAEGWK